jgi:hypothetical protein
LQRGHDGATEYAEKLDNLIYQMDKNQLLKDEAKLVLWVLDPFPPDVTITVGKETGEVASADFQFNYPAMKGQGDAYQTWKLDIDMRNVFIPPSAVQSGFLMRVGMKKEVSGWKFDIPVDAFVQKRVERMRDKYKHYVNPFKTMSMEVKNEPTTRENATTRLHTLLEEAARQ